MNRLEYIEKELAKLKKDIKREVSNEVKKSLQAQRQVLIKAKNVNVKPTTRKYQYKSEATRVSAIQRGKALRASLGEEKRLQIEKARQSGLEAYRTAQKIAKEDETYKKYWEEVKILRKQAKKVGVRLNLSNITGSPTQIKEAKYSPETQARFALGLASNIDVQNLMVRAEADGVITSMTDEAGNVIGYVYDGKGYTKEDLEFMFSSPKKFFPAKSVFWNWIEGLIYQNGGGKAGAEVVASEVFGS